MKLAVVVFTGGKLVASTAPRKEFWSMRDISHISGKRVGFELIFGSTGDEVFRVFALLPGDRAGELHYPSNYRGG